MTETATQRTRRLEKAKQKYNQKRAMEDKSAKRSRLDKEKERRQHETIERRAARLQRLREYSSQIREAWQ